MPVTGKEADGDGDEEADGGDDGDQDACGDGVADGWAGLDGAGDRVPGLVAPAEGGGVGGVEPQPARTPSSSKETAHRPGLIKVRLLTVPLATPGVPGCQPPPGPPPRPGSVILSGSRSSSSLAAGMPCSRAISRIVRPDLKPSLAIAAAAS